jgi:hypothetical protein
LLEDAHLVRYEEGRPLVQIRAAVLEQYKGGGAIYGSDIAFTVQDKADDLIAQGGCGYFSADTKSKEYRLFDGISVVSSRDHINIHAEALKWFGETGSLISGRETEVSIERARDERASETGGISNFVLTGTGFSANTFERTYQFAGAVSGRIVTDSDALDDAPPHETLPDEIVPDAAVGEGV